VPKELSEKQKQILLLIEQAIADSGYAPTVREIATEIGVKSPRSVSHHLDQLEKMGYIRRTREGVRNIIVTVDDDANPMKDLLRVPLCGWTAGGEPIYAEQNILDWIPISSRFFKTGSDEIFLLKVRGDSMSPKIEDGDVVIVKKQYTADPGETVVGLLGDETTVKKYLPREDHIVLQPENPSHEPIVVFPDELRIQGIVQGVMKYY
jgi:repressor LexA